MVIQQRVTKIGAMLRKQPGEFPASNHLQSNLDREKWPQANLPRESSECHWRRIHRAPPGRTWGRSLLSEWELLWCKRQSRRRDRSRSRDRFPSKSCWRTHPWVINAAGDLGSNATARPASVRAKSPTPTVSSACANHICGRAEFGFLTIASLSAASAALILPSASNAMPVCAKSIITVSRLYS